MSDSATGPSSRRISSLLLYWRTMRRLRPTQLAWKVFRHAQDLWTRSRGAALLDGSQWTIDESRLRAVAQILSPAHPAFPADGTRSAEAICDGEFTFLNRRRRLQSIDWNQRYESHLWSFNLHYFDYAVGLAWCFRDTGIRRYCIRLLELMNSWIEMTTPGVGDGWHPYPVSRRLVNWTYSIALLHDAGVDLPAIIVDSIGAQVEFLSRRLEFHVSGNHLLENSKALALSAGVLRGARARSLADKGRRLFWSQLDRQTLADGMHYERSPMYHLIALYGALELLTFQSALGIDETRVPIDQVKWMLRTASLLTRVDGEPHAFNDAAAGLAAPLTRVLPLAAEELSSPTADVDGAFALHEAGFFGLVDRSSGDRIVVDCGPPAAPDQPGHAHCDLLSFEWDLGGLPLVVDSGTCGYAGCWLRPYCRSTVAHNTLCVDDLEQSELWSVFRLAREARVRDACLVSSDPFVFSGAYAPYHDRTLTHQRILERSSRDLRIVDRVVAATGRRVRGFVHLHPATAVRSLSADRFELRAGPLTVLFRASGYQMVRVVRGSRDPIQGWYCPEFGRVQAAPTFVLLSEPYEGDDLVMEFTVRDG